MIAAANEHGLHIEAINAHSLGSTTTSASTDANATSSIQQQQDDSLREYCPEEDISKSQLYRIQLQL